MSEVLIWHGDAPAAPPAWLVKNVLPKTGLAVIAGQSEAGKTFVGIDLSMSVMTGRPFAGAEMHRKGGVLWFAAEGEDELLFRLEAANVERTAKLPFARQFLDVPNLSEKEAHAEISRIVSVAQNGMRGLFGLSLGLIVIDTFSAAAGLDDENSASQNQKILNMLRKVARASSCLVLSIDHYGKSQGSGIRGSSAKKAAFDAVLALLHQDDGRVLLVDKVRNGRKGAKVAYEIVEQADTCVVQWSPDGFQFPSAKAPTSALPPQRRGRNGTVAKDRSSSLLAEMQARPGASIEQLGERLGIPKSSVKASMDHLLRSRLVEKRGRSWTPINGQHEPVQVCSKLNVQQV